MRHWINFALCILVYTLVLGCRPQPTTPKLIFNIAGPEVPLHHPEWELYEYHFLAPISPMSASFKLQELGYRFLTSEEELLAKAYVSQNCHLISLSLGLLYLDHPMVVFIKSEKTKSIRVMGFDQGLAPRRIREFYEHTKLGEEYGWLVMRKKTFDY